LKDVRREHVEVFPNIDQRSCLRLYSHYMMKKLVDKLNSLEKINASLASTLKDEGKSKSVIESELDAMKSENERLLSLVKEQSEEKEELEKLESENTELRQQLELNEGGVEVKEELHRLKKSYGITMNTQLKTLLKRHNWLKRWRLNYKPLKNNWYNTEKNLIVFQRMSKNLINWQKELLN